MISISEPNKWGLQTPLPKTTLEQSLFKPRKSAQNSFKFIQKSTFFLFLGITMNLKQGIHK